MATIKVKRGTRSEINTAASASGLNQGELYLITDEDVLAVGTSSSTYEDINSAGLIDLTTDVTGTLPVANGGTGVTSLESLDASDLGSGSATDGYVLTADGAGNAAWEAASGGGASLPIDLLSSGASIRKSDGTTAVLSESSGVVTLENVTDAYLSGGVYLGGTNAANYLQDYETGSWTPTYVPITGSFTSITYDAATSGKYTKIGNVVYFNFYIRTDSLTVGTASGNIMIGGFPFTNLNSPTILNRAVFRIWSNSGWASNPPSGGYLLNGDTNARIIYRATAADVFSLNQVSHMATSTDDNELAGSGFYFVA